MCLLMCCLFLLGHGVIPNCFTAFSLAFIRIGAPPLILVATIFQRSLYGTLDMQIQRDISVNQVFAAGVPLPEKFLGVSRFFRVNGPLGPPPLADNVGSRLGDLALLSAHFYWHCNHKCPFSVYSSCWWCSYPGDLWSKICRWPWDFPLSCGRTNIFPCLVERYLLFHFQSRLW